MKKFLIVFLSVMFVLTGCNQVEQNDDYANMVEEIYDDETVKYAEFNGGINYNSYETIADYITLTIPKEFKPYYPMHDENTYYYNYFSTSNAGVQDSRLEMVFVEDNYESPKQMIESIEKYYSNIVEETTKMEEINGIEWYKLVLKGGGGTFIYQATCIDEKLFLIKYNITNVAKDEAYCMKLYNNTINSIKLKSI